MTYPGAQTVKNDPNCPKSSYFCNSKQHSLRRSQLKLCSCFKKKLLFFSLDLRSIELYYPKKARKRYHTERFLLNFDFFMGGWYRQNSSFSIRQGNFQILYLLNKLSKWLQLRLILKNRHCSLKWAQVEVIH